MKSPSYIKPFPKILKHSKAKGFTFILTRTIYLRQDIYNDLKSKNPNPQNISILLHEQEHLIQIKNTNTLEYISKYYLFPKFRLSEELEAYKKQFEYLKKNNLIYDLENVAKNLSGSLYLYATSYKNAKSIIDQAWNKS